MNRGEVKQEMIQGLLAAAGETLPTSSVRRVGRMGLTLFRVARVFRSASKRIKSGAPGASGAEPDLAQLAKVITSIGRLKGIAMKMGQIMSYIDMALPAELRDALSVLQTHAQPMGFDQVRRLVLAELGPRGPALLRHLEPEPISAASIGQVHRARLPDDTLVAVKIQYPEIAKAIESDFGPASVGTKMASLFYPNARIDDFVAEARERFLEECDYLHEAHCQDLFAALYADHPVLTVPAVHGEYCARKVLTTTFVKGLELDAFLASDPSLDTRDRLGAALFEFYLGSLFRHQLYNCDPHPGNYLFLPAAKAEADADADWRVAMLDHGCTRQFDARFVARLVNLTRAVYADDRDAIHRALLGLQMVREGKPYDYDTIRGFLRSFYGPMLTDAVTGVDLSSALEMRDVVRQKQQLMKFRLPGEFLFLLRIRFGLMSVLARLGARANWCQLEKQYVDDFSRDHPLLSERTSTGCMLG